MEATRKKINFKGSARESAAMNHLKINTALFICAVLMFRILFFNIFATSSFSSRQVGDSIKATLSKAMKRKAHFELTDSCETAEYLFSEICEEEDVSEQNHIESNPFFLIQALCAIIPGELTNKLKEIIPFYNHFSYASSHRYLVLQVFRT